MTINLQELADLFDLDHDFAEIRMNLDRLISRVSVANGCRAGDILWESLENVKASLSLARELAVPIIDMASDAGRLPPESDESEF